MSKSAKKFVPVPPPKVNKDAGNRPAEEIFEKEEECNVSFEVTDPVKVAPSSESQVNPLTEPPLVKTKKPRSQKQLDHLARIREKSLIARQQKAEQKRREQVVAPVQPPASVPVPVPEPQQVVSAPIPVHQNYLSAEQIQNIVKETMTHTLHEYSQKAVARDEARAAENTKKHQDLVKQEAELRQKKIQQSLLHRPRKGRRY